MRPGRAERRRRVSAPALALAASLLLAAALAAARIHGDADAAAATREAGAAALEGRPDRAPASPALRFVSVLPAARLSAPVRAIIVRDPATDAFYGSRGRMDSTIARWRTALEAIGAEARVMSPEAIAAARSPAEVVIIPGALSAGGELQRVVDDALARGSGVLLTWLSGAYGPTGRWASYGLILKSTGAQRADTLEARPSDYVTFLGATPLSADIPPGARLEVRSATNIALRTPNRDAFWSDVQLDPQPARGEPLLDGAIAHAWRGRGRVVYWGFDLGQVVDDQWDRGLTALLVRNSVAWAAGRPLAAVEPWPGGKRVAAVIAQDVEYGYPNSRNAVDTLRALGIRSTYFVVSDRAVKDREVSFLLASSGEIGSHSENHQPFGHQALEVQTARLERTQAQLTALFGKPVAGFRPPSEDYDDATLHAWARAGGTYVFGTLDLRTASPEILTIGDRQLVLLGRTFSDDIGPYRANHEVNRAMFARAYLDGYEKVRALGGLAMVSYHSQMVARPELVGALGIVARHIVRDSTAWLATAGEVADWWRSRAALRVRAHAAAGDVIDVEVENAGAAAVRSAVVSVALPPAARVGTVDGATALPRDDIGARLLVDSLPAGARRVIRLRLGSEVARGR